MKEFTNSKEIDAYLLKQAAIVKAALAKLEAVTQELKAVKAKFSANDLAKGYSAESVAKFEQRRKAALVTFGYCERYLADAKASSVEIAKSFVR